MTKKYFWNVSVENFELQYYLVDPWFIVPLFFNDKIIPNRFSLPINVNFIFRNKVFSTKAQAQIFRNTSPPAADISPAFPATRPDNRNSQPVPQASRSTWKRENHKHVVLHSLRNHAVLAPSAQSRARVESNGPRSDTVQATLRWHDSTFSTKNSIGSEIPSTDENSWFY